MRTVRDESGTRLLLIKQSGDSSRVRDPETGEERYVPNDELEFVDESPLDTAAGTVPDATRTILTAVRDDRSLGLLFELDRRGPLAVRDLLSGYDLCESDLHGLLGEFRAAGLVDEATVAGERGYRLTDEAVEGLDYLRAGEKS
ncbi:hypothetical protein BV210_03275 [Halorientalis sp. IM1011]|uniref:DUF7346 family protein n=1 Tax=Halorientalis sp. IM1011 TaxID=1932360 RepID=UPI00097CD682|nr:hypothetical protein [Halorientalis sp. IM1011]AQL41796.1 hypothetical protein BV210_03275 [Halorientalis sp. IM1011]